jgi:hypothetical protein
LRSQTDKKPHLTNGHCRSLVLVRLLSQSRLECPVPGKPHGLRTRIPPGMSHHIRASSRHQRGDACLTWGRTVFTSPLNRAPVAGQARCREGQPRLSGATRPSQPSGPVSRVGPPIAGAQAAGRVAISRDSQGRAQGTSFEERVQRAIKPGTSFPRTTRGRSSSHPKAHRGSIGSPTENPAWKRASQQSDRHLVTMAALSRHFLPRRPV